MVSPSPLNGGPSFGREADVQEKLARERRRRRAPGDTAYPLEYSHDMADFDAWEQMFLTKLCRGLTMHEFTTPPTRVLDLGCGGGTWVLEAASQWKDTHFVGLDIKDLQPDFSILASITSDYDALAKRVKWVHSNFLDRLHFASDNFDFIRVSCIGLGVPEDEWPDILEEVHRVLKPGGVLEVTVESRNAFGELSAFRQIIEEDLMFPAGKTNKPVPEPMVLPTRSSTSEHSMAPRKSDVLLGRHPPYGTMHSSAGASSVSQPPSQRTSKVSLATKASATSLIVPTAPDVRDHSRLRAAWAAVIERRFLAAQPSSILQLYLSSTFAEYQQRPAVQILLPPNSRGAGGADPPAPALADERPREHARAASAMNASGTTRIAGFNDAALDANREWVARTAPMHLARTVRTIEHCKAALRTEYEIIYARVPCYGDNTVAEDFEMYWENWRNDMMDRIGMRATVLEQMHWPEPSDDPDRGPNWRKWRAAAIAQDPPPLPTMDLDRKRLNGTAPGTGTLAVPRGTPTLAPPELCRSIRGFVAFKAPAAKGFAS